MIDYGDPALPDRYWAKVYPEPNSGCWLWGASDNGVGYGVFGIGGRPKNGGRQHLATRLMLAASLGRELDPDERALHTCDNPPCVNPDHLYAGTHAQNMADMTSRRRHRFGERAPTAIVDADTVAEIRRQRADGVTCRALAARYGISASAISLIGRGATWSHVAGPLTHDTRTRTPERI